MVRTESNVFAALDDAARSRLILQTAHECAWLNVNDGHPHSFNAGVSPTVIEEEQELRGIAGTESIADLRGRNLKGVRRLSVSFGRALELPRHRGPLASPAAPRRPRNRRSARSINLPVVLIGPALVLAIDPINLAIHLTLGLLNLAPTLLLGLALSCADLTLDRALSNPLAMAR
jgi:hypothetical protein